MGKCSKHAYSCLPFRLDLTAMVVVVMHVPVASRCLHVQLDLTAMAVVVMHVAAAPKHGQCCPYGHMGLSCSPQLLQCLKYPHIYS
jgi:hypothetical protein